jgi:hypothetical protein
MEYQSRTYNIQTGAVEPGRGTQPSQQIYDVRGQRGAPAPHDQPYTFVTGSEGAGQRSFTGPGYRWSPNASETAPIDPHDAPFDDIGDSIEPVEGDIPDNIVGGSRGHVPGGGGYPPGPFSRSRGL